MDKAQAIKNRRNVRLSPGELIRAYKENIEKTGSPQFRQLDRRFGLCGGTYCNGSRSREILIDLEVHPGKPRPSNR